MVASRSQFGVKSATYADLTETAPSTMIGTVEVWSAPVHLG